VWLGAAAHGSVSPCSYLYLPDPSRVVSVLQIRFLYQVAFEGLLRGVVVNPSLVN
jgi:hypothetical protein